MARRSLSSQVIEEVDRVVSLIGDLTELTDPITAHLLGNGLEGLQRIKDMCYAARTGPTDAIVSDTPLGTAFGPDKLAQAQNQAPATTRRPRTHRKSAGEKA